MAEKRAPGRLKTYRAMRNPKRTPEPMGRARSGSRATAPTFVIQEHHARALHWDFRLKHEGVLVSWALPKGLPDDPKKNHLAVHTEDHPLGYEDFEGEIPKGEYGGGRVQIWDKGTYETEKWSDREVMVVLHGKKAQGRYVLFATNGKNWMIHRMDPPKPGFQPVPDVVLPMLATAGDLPKKDDGWAYEFKWDGVRAIVYVEGGRVRATSRNKKSIEGSFPELRELGEFLGSRAAVLDGELVAFDDEGKPSFGLLQQRLHLGSSAKVAERARHLSVTYLAFDLIYLEGEFLTDRTYDERRELLESLRMAGDTFATPPTFRDHHGADVLKASREAGLEGLVAKRRTSVYKPGIRNTEWLKIKNFRTQEAVIGGWTDGRGERSDSFGALLLGLPAAGGLEYIGKVGTGFSDAARRELLKTLRPLARVRSPFVTNLAKADGDGAHFVKPTVVGEVRFGEWTRDGRLRHPSWRGLRSDKAAEEVIREP